MEEAKQRVQSQRTQIHNVRIDRDNFCWMYAVIIIELMLLAFLLNMGLS
jgi:hypothetical protein